MTSAQTKLGRSPKGSSRLALQRLAVACALFVGLAAGVFWLRQEPQALAHAPQQAASAAALLSANSDAAGKRQSAASTPRPSQTASGSAAKPASSATDAAAISQLDAQWCSHGALAYQQYEASARQQHANPGTFDGQQALTAQMQHWPPHQALEYVRAETDRRWIAELQRRGDDRSRAAALYLASANGPNAPAALIALSALAHTSPDPFVAALADQRSDACRRQAACRPLSPEQRLAKDPSNLVAFISAYGNSPDVIKRLAAAPTPPNQARNYNTDLLAMVQALPSASKEGVYRQVELEQQAFLFFSWSPPGYSKTIQTCKALSAQAHGERAACESMANTLWRSGESLMERMLSVLIADGLALSEQEAWVGRRAELEGMKHASIELSRWFYPDPIGGDGCAFQRHLRPYLQALSTQGEWAALEAMRRAKVVRTSQ